MAKRRGWFGEPGRHALAAMGIRTKVPRKSGKVSVVDESEARLYSKVSKWLKNKIDAREREIKKLEDELDVDVQYADVGYLGEVDIDIWSKDGSKHLEMTYSTEDPFFDEYFAEELGISKEKARELLEDRTFFDKFGDDLLYLQYLNAMELALEDLAAGSIDFDEDEWEE